MEKHVFCLMILLILQAHLCNAAKALKDSGAKEIYSYIAHGVLSGEALNKIENSAIKELVLTDSIQASYDVKNTKILDILVLLL